ncbi:MAG: insulinase family protein [Candidatus Eisenbacteria bacterium]
MEILPGRDGLVHISSSTAIGSPRVEDVVQENDIVLVKVIGVDDEGKIDCRARLCAGDGDRGRLILLPDRRSAPLGSAAAERFPVGPAHATQLLASRVSHEVPATDRTDRRASSLAAGAAERTRDPGRTGRAHSVHAIGVWVRSGSRRCEPEGQIGIAHLLEHMVFKGTRQHSAYQIAKRIEALGGQVDAFTTKETTCYHARVFAGHRAETVHLLGEILSQSAFPRVELDKERQVVIEEIHSYDDNPEEYVFDLATEEVWRGHPLGNSILGRAEALPGWEPAT